MLKPILVFSLLIFHLLDSKFTNFSIDTLYSKATGVVINWFVYQVISFFEN